MKMMVFSKQNYEDQDEGRIMKAARTQQYIIFPAPNSFLNDELKTEIGMNSKTDEFCSLKVHIDHEDKESKMHMAKVKKYD
jgi:hypothetical protein